VRQCPQGELSEKVRAQRLADPGATAENPRRGPAWPATGDTRADYSAGKREQGEMGVETSFKTFGQLAETSQPSVSEVDREKVDANVP